MNIFAAKPQQRDVQLTLVHHGKDKAKHGHIKTGGIILPMELLFHAIFINMHSSFSHTGRKQ